MAYAAAIFAQTLVAGPDWATKTTAISSVILACAALVALGSFLDAKKTRHGQVIADLSRRWDDQVVLESVELFRVWDSEGATKLIDALWGEAAKRPETDQERAAYSADLASWYKLSIYPNLIETIGVFLEEDVITEKVVYRMWGPSIATAWKEWREPVLHLRKVTKTPEVWEWFEAAGIRMTQCAADARAAADTQKSQVVV